MLGRALLFFWIEYADICLIERTWLNIHIQYEGVRPALNKVNSPIEVHSRRSEAFARLQVGQGEGVH